jgi:L-rhamnose mutarotase
MSSPDQPPREPGEKKSKACASAPCRRYGMVIRVRPENYEEYRRLHASVWPGVLARISASSIRNYSIFHKEGWLFSYFEYWGKDFEADMRVMAADAETRKWWAIMEPMQDPLPSRAPGEWWARMEEVFHHDGA